MRQAPSLHLPANMPEMSMRPAKGGVARGAAAPSSSAASSSSIFVHFIPPPLRETGKKDLCWIVHPCDGSGCRAVKHVSFLSLDSFSTFEGPPPDQQCGCTVANHHLRGRGTVRWKEDGQAVIESLAEDAKINGLCLFCSLVVAADSAAKRKTVSAASYEFCVVTAWV